ncbi:hypothetical protein [Symmachiella dynata]|uniref:hypothetical protein n=1 Tax=Symmachiella dynata TaxID=2527995 RepID=UPI0030ED5BF3
MKQSSQRRVSGAALILFVCLLPILFCYLLLMVRVMIGSLVLLLVMFLCCPAMFHLMMCLTGQAICHVHAVDRQLARKVRLPDILRIVDLTSGRSQYRHEFAWIRYWSGG